MNVCGSKEELLKDYLQFINRPVLLQWSWWGDLNPQFLQAV